MNRVCVCCGFRALPGFSEFCPLCGWVDDVHRLRWPYRANGANALSLIEAQKSVTVPDPSAFDRDPFWRPIDLARDRFEPRGRELALWPEDRTVLYWWRRRPGTAWWEEPAPTVPPLDESAEFNPVPAPSPTPDDRDIGPAGRRDEDRRGRLCHSRPDHRGMVVTKVHPLRSSGDESRSIP